MNLLPILSNPPAASSIAFLGPCSFGCVLAVAASLHHLRKRRDQQAQLNRLKEVNSSFFRRLKKSTMVKHRGGTPSAAPSWPLDVPVDTICPKGTIAPSLSVGPQKNVLRRPSCRNHRVLKRLHPLWPTIPFAGTRYRTPEFLGKIRERPDSGL